MTLTIFNIISLPLITIAILVGACDTTWASRDLNAYLGWLDGTCLATRHDKLQAGTPVNIVVLDDPQRHVSTRIHGPVTDSKDCDPLLEDRSAINLSSGWRFYRVEDTDQALTGMPGIAVLNSDVKIEVVAGQALADLNLDGVAERFSLCTTSEGVRFEVLTTDQSKPLWSGYEYLGYDVEPSCGD